MWLGNLSAKATSSYVGLNKHQVWTKGALPSLELPPSTILRQHRTGGSTNTLGARTLSCSNTESSASFTWEAAALRPPWRLTLWWSLSTEPAQRNRSSPAPAEPWIGPQTSTLRLSLALDTVFHTPFAGKYSNKHMLLKWYFCKLFIIITKTKTWNRFIHRFSLVDMKLEAQRQVTT